MRPFGVLIALLPVLAGSAEPALDAREVRLQVHASAPRATVGDRLLVRVEVVHPPGVSFGPPVPVPGEGASLTLEPVKAPAEEKGADRDVFTFEAQAFETGTLQIPTFRLEWKKAGGEGGTATSQAIPVEIVSVLKGSQESPSDLKPPAEIPAPPFPWGWALLAALLVTLCGALVYRLRRRKSSSDAPGVPIVPLLPPHEQAYQELERLLASPLLREGKVKEFHVELSEIVKRYLASRFDVETLERTTFEVLEDLKRVRIGSEPMGVAREFFSETDLVKFARYRPVEDQIRRSVDRAYHLVDLTKLASVPERVQEQAASPPLVAGGAG